MKTAEMYYITVNGMIKLSFLREGDFQSQIFCTIKNELHYSH